jgi:hypothetical protein
VKLDLLGRGWAPPVLALNRNDDVRRGARQCVSKPLVNVFRAPACRCCRGCAYEYNGIADPREYNSFDKRLCQGAGTLHVVPEPERCFNSQHRGTPESLRRPPDGIGRPEATRNKHS